VYIVLLVIIVLLPYNKCLGRIQGSNVLLAVAGDIGLERLARVSLVLLLIFVASDQGSDTASE